MSNTTTLSPYEPAASASSGSPGMVAACIVGAAAGIGALAHWLTEETEDEKSAVQQDKVRRRQENLVAFGQRHGSCMKPADMSRLSQLHLHIRDMGALIHSAEKLGYSIQPAPLPSMSHSGVSDLVLLADARGNRIAVERNEKGRLRLTTAGGLAPMKKMVCQHTLDRTLDHLKKTGMTVQTAALSNGEIQVLARGNAGHPAASHAEIKTRIHGDGTVWLDVERVRGNACETIVRDMAKAVGAEICGMHKKPAYFEMPGEPAKTTVKASS